jgi:hypothetical protein
MAAPNWIGGGLATAQIETDLFAGTWVVGDHITLAVGGASFTYSITSVTIATFLPLLAAALEALTDPRFTENAYVSTATQIVVTSNTPGQPFILVWSTNSVAGTITPAATVPSSGPNDWSTASNWSTGTVPVAADTPTLFKEGEWIKFGLAQSGVTVASLRCIAQTFRAGLPYENANGYPEYRPTALALGVTSGMLQVTKSGTFKLNVGSVQTAFQVNSTGPADETNVASANFQGTSASNVWKFFGGVVDLAYQPGQLAAGTLNVASGATVRCGTGFTCATVNNLGGNLQLNSAVGTLLAHPTSSSKAYTTIFGTGAVAQLTMQGGTVDYQTTGELNGATIMGGSSTLTFDNDQQAKTILATITAYSPLCKVSDVFGVVSAGFAVYWADCNAGKLGIRANITTTVLPHA